MFAGTCLIAVAAPPAAAQMFGGTPGPVVGGSPNVFKNRPAPPPALPGTHTTSDDTPAPPDKALTDMPPTEALFDAINRGDVAGVRDSLNRGADFNAPNVLGLTPIDLSIDLGRKEITFLLLSLRGAPSAPNAEQTAAAVPTKPAHVRHATARSATVAKMALSTVARAPADHSPLPAARQFAGDGGTPNPQVGFLGFGGPPQPP